MSRAAEQAATFYRQVARTGCVWTLRDAGGFPAPLSTGGMRAQPFWSSSFRVLRMIRTVPAFRGFEPIRLSWEEFRDQWLPGLNSSGLLVGVNWSGPRATGYDVDPHQVLTLVERAIRLAGSERAGIDRAERPARRRRGAAGEVVERSDEPRAADGSG